MLRNDTPLVARVIVLVCFTWGALDLVHIGASKLPFWPPSWPKA